MTVPLVEATIAELAAALDLAIFVDTPDDVRFERRLSRDIRERGRTPEDVRAQVDRWVRPMYERYVEPARHRAHLVLDGRHPRDENVRRVLALLPDTLR
jgi:uridine kinase